ncbi:MAG TPA: hypothetical protein PKX38_06740 [Alphaproteobacteria bacterium]|nr:hypothetical protein [Micavibrio sp.]MBK9563300.1 hypothetical protein [Micavibrio sp.]HQX27618.1 hypothetical protein [Alphaproteobacteria bacterium]
MHEQKIIKKFLAYFSWKIIFLDVVKFYIYLILFYGLAFLLMWAHAHLALEADKMTFNEILFDPNDVDLKDYSFDIENYKWLGQKMGFYMFVLVCLGVFFTNPPKSFKHISIVIILIFLINNGMFLSGTISEYVYDFFILSGFALMSWILSLAWHEYKNKKHPQTN